MRLFFMVQREKEWNYVTTIGDDADDVIPQTKIYRGRHYQISFREHHLT
jgi:hypothetical protein